MSEIKNVCVYGASSQQIHPDYIAVAEELGRLVAGQGYGMVFGGGASGLMGAAARGVKAAGGTLTGVAPEFFKQPGVLDEGCTQFVYTNTMRERKQYMEEHSEAFVVLPGGIGTLEEFFEIFTLRQLGRHQKPILLLNTRGYYDALRRLLQQAAQEGFLADDAMRLLDFCDTPQQVLAGLRAALGGAE